LGNIVRNWKISAGLAGRDNRSGFLIFAMIHRSI
jgi:hypothetical protein